MHDCLQSREEGNVVVIFCSNDGRYNKVLTTQLVDNGNDELMIQRSYEDVGIFIQNFLQYSGDYSQSLPGVSLHSIMKPFIHFFHSSYHFLLSTCNILSINMGSDTYIWQCLAKYVENSEYGALLFPWTHLKNSLILYFLCDSISYNEYFPFFLCVVCQVRCD